MASVQKTALLVWEPPVSFREQRSPPAHGPVRQEQGCRLERWKMPSARRAVINNYNPLPSPHDKALPRLSSWPRDLDHRQGKPHPQFVFQINLHVMQSVLLKLYPAKIMDVGCMAFHLL